MKTLFYKITIVIVIMFVAQIITYRYFVPPIPEITELRNILQNKYDTLYFGDSTVDFVDEKDTDTSSVVTMLHTFKPDYRVADFSHSANHTEVYEATLEYLSRSPTKPKAVILEINPATFSPVWDQTPGLQFEKEKFLLKNSDSLIAYFYRPLAILQAINFNPISEKQYLETPVYRGGIFVGTVADFTNEKKFASTTSENIRDTFIARYMYTLTPQHRKLTALSKTIDIAQKSGIKVYTYITPINYKKGQQYVSPDFMFQTKVNTDLICKTVELKGVPCLNLAYTLDSSSFNYNRGYATEHVNETGRRLIARELTKVVGSE